MSTSFRPSKKIHVRNLLDGHLEKFGIREALASAEESTAPQEISELRICLTDGCNFLWVSFDEEGFVSGLTRYLPNGAPGKILQAISEAFDTAIFSEYEPEFWGFDTQEEWDTWEAELSKKLDDKFYADILKFVSGEAHGIGAGTVGELQAQIAKRLVAEEPSLISPERRVDFVDRIKMIYESDHAVVVTLSETDMAVVKLLATHEDDLPQA